MNGCAPGLALIERLKATRKWAVRLGGLGIINPKPGRRSTVPRPQTTAPLVEKIVSQAYETPDEALVSSLQQSVRREKNEVLRTKQELSY